MKADIIPDGDRILVKLYVDAEKCERCGMVLVPCLFPTTFAPEQFPPELFAPRAPEGDEQTGRPLCVECYQKGPASFVCCLCHQERHVSLAKTRGCYGEGYAHKTACSVCYETLTAGEWDRRVYYEMGHTGVRVAPKGDGSG